MDQYLQSKSKLQLHNGNYTITQGENYNYTKMTKGDQNYNFQIWSQII